MRIFPYGWGNFTRTSNLMWIFTFHHFATYPNSFSCLIPSCMVLFVLYPFLPLSLSFFLRNSLFFVSNASFLLTVHPLSFSLKHSYFYSLKISVPWHLSTFISPLFSFLWLSPFPILVFFLCCTIYPPPSSTSWSLPPLPHPFPLATTLPGGQGSPSKGDLAVVYTRGWGQ